MHSRLHSHCSVLLLEHTSVNVSVDRSTEIIVLALVLLDMEALQPDELLKPKLAQRDSFARILPSCPRKILVSISIPIDN